VTDRTNPLPAERLLAAIVETSDDAIVSKSLDGIIQSWNAAAERVFGYTASQAVGRHISLIIPPDRLKEEELIMSRLRAGERVDHFETVRIRSDGRPVPISLTISPIKDDTGRVIGASKIARDITERREAHEALLQADRRKDEFLATLAHELRNPLAPIWTAAQVLKLKSLADPDLRWGSEVIDRQMRHMVRLLEDLLDVSRISQNKLELRKEKVQLDVVLRASIETSRPVIDEARHQLSVTLPEEPLHLDGDPVRLAQVFSNLLNNAAKFMEAGGRIVVSAQRRGDHVRVAVQDEGLGIATESLPRLFTMFSQGLPAAEHSHGGLGIGLSLARTLVEMHGGTVEAHSEGLGKGSIFVVTLPLAGERHPERSMRPQGAQCDADRAGRRLLIVDDSKDSADTLAELMRIHGHEVHTAYEGATAVKLVTDLRPEVMLVDLGMPGVNGYEVCRKIRAQPGGEDVFLIAVTGWGRENDKTRTRDAGFDGHLVKPVDGGALAEMIASLPSIRLNRASSIG
jgi:PAS domain S-box-containing protein